MSMQNGWRRLGMGMMALALAGCATIVHRGGKQRVLINSVPPGATATIDGVIKIQTPGEVKLKRGKDHVVVIEKEGYQPGQTLIDREFSGWVIGNIAFGGLIGLAVDFGTGAAWNLEPETVTVTLTPAPTASVPAQPEAQ